MKIWKAYYKNGLLQPTLVYGNDKRDAMERAEATYLFHSKPWFKTNPTVERIEEMPEGTVMSGPSIMPCSEFPPDHMDFKRWRDETMAKHEENS